MGRLVTLDFSWGVEFNRQFSPVAWDFTRFCSGEMIMRSPLKSGHFMFLLRHFFPGIKYGKYILEKQNCTIPWSSTGITMPSIKILTHGYSI